MKAEPTLKIDAPAWAHHIGVAVTSMILLLFTVTAIGVHQELGTAFPFWWAVIYLETHGAIQTAEFLLLWLKKYDPDALREIESKINADQ